LVLQQEEEKEMAKILLQQQQQFGSHDRDEDHRAKPIDLSQPNQDPNAGYGGGGGCC
jgi:hypothetical protein